MISYSGGKGKWKIPQGKGIVFLRILCYGKRETPKGGAVGHILRKEVRLNADYITYRAVHRYDCCKKQKPPPRQVTVSIAFE